ncbi:hypothetical protein BJ742DRAFT_852551 [Cladochytrium replicatum]|nr:hypothetical protein BJ742DRAFT_852551 [Cladochytrium replicatum]
MTTNTVPNTGLGDRTVVDDTRSTTSIVPRHRFDVETDEKPPKSTFQKLLRSKFFYAGLVALVIIGVIVAVVVVATKPKDAPAPDLIFPIQKLASATIREAAVPYSTSRSIAVKGEIAVFNLQSVKSLRSSAIGWFNSSSNQTWIQGVKDDVDISHLIPYTGDSLLALNRTIDGNFSIVQLNIGPNYGNVSLPTAAFNFSSFPDFPNPAFNASLYLGKNSMKLFVAMTDRTSRTLIYRLGLPGFTVEANTTIDASPRGSYRFAESNGFATTDTEGILMIPSSSDTHVEDAFGFLLPESMKMILPTGSHTAQRRFISPPHRASRSQNGSFVIIGDPILTFKDVQIIDASQSPYDHRFVANSTTSSTSNWVFSSVRGFNAVSEVMFNPSGKWIAESYGTLINITNPFGSLPHPRYNVSIAFDADVFVDSLASSGDSEFFAVGQIGTSQGTNGGGMTTNTVPNTGPGDRTVVDDTHSTTSIVPRHKFDVETDEKPPKSTFQKLLRSKFFYAGLVALVIIGVIVAVVVVATKPKDAPAPDLIFPIQKLASATIREAAVPYSTSRSLAVKGEIAVFNLQSVKSLRSSAIGWFNSSSNQTWIQGVKDDVDISHLIPYTGDSFLALNRTIDGNFSIVQLNIGPNYGNVSLPTAAFNFSSFPDFPNPAFNASLYLGKNSMKLLVAMTDRTSRTLIYRLGLPGFTVEANTTIDASPRGSYRFAESNGFATTDTEGILMIPSSSDTHVEDAFGFLLPESMKMILPTGSYTAQRRFISPPHRASRSQNGSFVIIGDPILTSKDVQIIDASQSPYDHRFVAKSTTSSTSNWVFSSVRGFNAVSEVMFNPSGKWIAESYGTLINITNPFGSLPHPRLNVSIAFSANVFVYSLASSGDSEFFAVGQIGTSEGTNVIISCYKVNF